MGLPEGAITNEEGQVAMRYMKQASAYVKCGNNEYIFQVRANISMAYVEPEDVGCMLQVTSSCCGGRKKQAVFYIDETHHRRWTNGGGR